MRNLLKTSIAALAVMIAFPAFAAENVVWWDFLSGGDGVRMKALIQRFNDEHKDKIQIKGTTLEWGIPYYTKLQTSTAVGQGPDIATYHLSRLAGAVSAKTVSPIDPKELEAVGLKDSDYPPNAIAASTVDNVRYAVPFDVHGEVLYYNKNVLKELGALGKDGKPTGIDTLEGWRALLVKAKEAGKNGVVIASSSGDLRDIYTLFGQLGGQLTTDGKFLQGDNFDKMQKAYGEVTDWVKQGWAQPYIDPETITPTFLAGQSAFFLNGNWELPTMETEVAKGSGFDYGMVNIPAWMGKPANWADSHSFVMPNNVGVTMTPEKRAAVLEVIRWMNVNSLEWAGAGHIPAYLPVSTSDAYKALKPQADYAAMALNAFYMPKTPLTGAASKFDDDWQNMASGPLNGDGDLKETLETFRDHMDSQ
ncbi:hypothetical protein [Rhizobium leguminosarum]|uniref:hypothetical protein n=1 Tax=Rhizobium leguminosarum TaxID=384 RepID=UPI001C975AFA|nr:hypothetical protein [Rhizobium leguminosarum]MBY5346156.1 hypothetical protein [Rhizobium leguminosarum]